MIESLPLLGLEKTNLELETPHGGIFNTSGTPLVSTCGGAGGRAGKGQMCQFSSREWMEGESPHGTPVSHVLASKFEMVECGLSWNPKKTGMRHFLQR